MVNRDEACRNSTTITSENVITKRSKPVNQMKLSDNQYYKYLVSANEVL